MEPSQESIDIETIRHSLAHVLAQAVSRIYPGARLGIGPAVKNGFYYEFELGHKISESDLPEIEEEMSKIIAADMPFKRIIIPREQAFDTLHQLGQIYKTELLHKIPDESISFYKTGEEFIDLCRGPHVSSTSNLNNFKLTKISKVNWLNDKNRPQLIKIEGVGFKTQKKLSDYFESVEELKKREHMQLGQSLELFLLDDSIGKDLPLWLKKGNILRRELTSFLEKELESAEFEYIETPELAKQSFYDASGYLNYNSQKFLGSIKDSSSKSLLRLNSSSHHLKLYSSKKRSYKELPYKTFENSVNYFTAQTNTQGLMKMRRQIEPQGIVVCTYDQMVQEIQNLVSKTKTILNQLGFYEFNLSLVLPQSTHPQNYIANEQNWRQAIEFLKIALEKSNMSAKPVEGHAEFFGPKLVFSVKDNFDREWDLSEITIDLNLAQLLKLRYIDSKNNETVPAIIHYSPISSLEKCLALLIEHYGGAFPLWLSPIQVSLISISKKYNDVVTKIKDVLIRSDLRAELDLRNETMQTKIRDAQMKQIPYMLIIGEKEIKTDSVSVRPRTGRGLGLMRIEEFINKIKGEIDSKTLENL